VIILRVRAITNKQAAFLDTLASRGFGDGKMDQIINNPSLVDDISNLLISKGPLSSSRCSKTCCCPKCEKWDVCEALIVRHFPSPPPSIFKDDEWPLMEENDSKPARRRDDDALVCD